MQKHPKLLRRPLPPKFLKVPLYQEKVHTAKTTETEQPDVESAEDEATSIERDETGFPGVVSRDQSYSPISVQTLSLDHPIQEKATVPIPIKQYFQNFYFPVPDIAVHSIFVPSCGSASARLFGKDTSQTESSGSSKQAPYKIKKIYVDNRLKNILILSPEYTKTSSNVSSPSTTPFKLQEVQSEYLSLPKGVESALPRKHPLMGFRGAMPSPISGIISTKIEKPLHWTRQTTTAVLTINDVSAKVSLPTPVLPRKPRRQSEIEMIAAEYENIELSKKESLLSGTERKDSIKSRKTEEPLREGIHGGGYRTIAVTQYEAIMAITKTAIINCEARGRNALNLKGFFLLNCPDLTPLAYQLIYLNLSFNDLCNFPTEVFCLKHLQVLILRNNPIKEIPSEIQQLKFLRIFIISFNLITSLPPGLFTLTFLEELDISYNDIESIPNEIQRLRSLEKLNLDGNYITSLPPGILRLHLKKLHLDNTFTHPCFWTENSLNTARRLVDLIAFFIVKNNLHSYYNAIPMDIQKLLRRASAVSVEPCLFLSVLLLCVDFPGLQH
ncbi:leucine-rich repeat-containing protein 63 isoform X2 [Dasypus novemcinctus]|uniref:leucine-rich repeat-containing protein 63 isoform X2 n=1 Tax=Dasypus novemcinctus TaxID=9361 RepID=UPI00265F9965|nr:leucine-rich repeat-containing protein 63 isoform X2 [Dasypus novemcinctus]